MAIINLSDLPEEQTLPEYRVGAGLSKIIYPGIDQCISITGWSEFGLLGTHISPGSTQQDIDDTFQLLLTGGGANYTKWYIVGNFVKHAQDTQVGWVSPAKVGKAAKKRLSKKAVYLAYDTTSIAANFSWGIHIRAERTASQVTFSYGSGNVKACTYTLLPPVFVKV